MDENLPDGRPSVRDLTQSDKLAIEIRELNRNFSRNVLPRIMDATFTQIFRTIWLLFEVLRILLGRLDRETVAFRILTWTCPKDDLDAVLGDMEERLVLYTERYGVKPARAWYRAQLIKSSVAFFWRTIERMLKLESIFRRLGGG